MKYFLCLGFEVLGLAFRVLDFSARVLGLEAVWGRKNGFGCFRALSFRAWGLAYGFVCLFCFAGEVGG